MSENLCGNDAIEVDASMLARTADDTVRDLIDHFNQSGQLGPDDILALYQTRDRLNFLLSAATAGRSS